MGPEEKTKNKNKNKKTRIEPLGQISPTFQKLRGLFLQAKFPVSNTPREETTMNTSKAISYTEDTEGRFSLPVPSLQPA